MARIETLERENLERTTVHSPVHATYASFRDADGNFYLQIDSYGSRDRKLKGKKSQSMQFDRKMAETLLALLKETFRID